MLEVGQRLGSYEIAARLKSGGMATLFLARRRGAAGFSRHVAIKVVHPHLSEDASFVRMFVDEALLSAKIEHPNVVHVIELGEERGMYFLAMEYVHGCTLSQLARALAAQGRVLSVPTAVSICMQIADGLHAAHETVDEDGKALGVVHRDVSPQNVLLSYRGFVKVIDFGIAKSRGRQQTATGTLKGKLRYMAPEQARGRAVDRRTDVYALGIVMWELLAGRRLFDGGDDFAILEQVREPTISGPRTIVPQIPEALEQAVLWALAPKPDERPASMKAWRDALAAAVPEATGVGASDIAAVVAEAMPEEIARQSALLPESVTRELPADLSVPASEVTRSRFTALTESRPNIQVDIDEGPSPAAPEPDHALRQVRGHVEVGPRRRLRIGAVVLAAAGALGAGGWWLTTSAVETPPAAPPVVAALPPTPSEPPPITPSEPEPTPPATDPTTPAVAEPVPTTRPDARPGRRRRPIEDRPAEAAPAVPPPEPEPEPEPVPSTAAPALFDDI